MRLTHLLEDRTALLHLQQRLIDDLPDDIDVELIVHPVLGPCLELKVGEKLLRRPAPWPSAARCREPPEPALVGVLL